MSKSAESASQLAPLTREEFEDFFYAIGTILDLSLPDFDATLYNYNQAKRLLLRFGLNFTRGMKKEHMMSDLIALYETSRRENTSASASLPTTETDDTADEETQLQIAAEQVAASDAEEALVEPTTDIEKTKAEHGAEMADLDEKLAALEKEMNMMREEMTNVTATSVAKSDFTEGIQKVNLRITQQAFHLQSVAETLDQRFPGETPFTSLLNAPTPPETRGDLRGAMAPSARGPREVFYGFQHKDGRRTFCPARKESEDDRLR